MNKAQLRREYIALRKNIADKEQKSHTIFMKTLSLSYLQSAKTVAVYSSLPSEVNTSELIEYLLKGGKEVYLPKVFGVDMEFYRISSLSDLNEKGSLGIYEPTSNDTGKLEPNELDIIIMPGVCFDKSGNRIGFGKGYYDRYLSGFSDIYKIAICFDEQIIGDCGIESEAHDIKADIIVTDRCIYTPKNPEKTVTNP